MLIYRKNVVVHAEYRLVSTSGIDARRDKPLHTKLAHVAERPRAWCVPRKDSAQRSTLGRRSKGSDWRLLYYFNLLAISCRAPRREPSLPLRRALWRE